MRLVMVKRLLLVAVLAASAGACSRPAEQATTRTTTTPRANHVPPCRTDELRVSFGETIQPASGYSPIVVAFTNRSTKTCSIQGYLTVSLYDSAGATLPFTFGHRETQEITGAAPHLVLVAPGAAAFGALDKYRCDIHTDGEVTTARLTPPNGGGALVLDLHRGPVWGYCGMGDPGSFVALTPIESTWRALLSPVRHATP